MSLQKEMVATLKPVAAALNLLKIPYYVGGSVASSYHGAVRSTMDIDLVADLREEHIEKFLSQFGEDFYISESADDPALISYITKHPLR